MKKRLRNLSLTICFICLLVAGANSGWADENRRMVQCASSENNDLIPGNEIHCLLEESNEIPEESKISEDSTEAEAVESSDNVIDEENPLQSESVKEAYVDGPDRTNPEFSMILDGTYNYCPSVIVTDENIDMFYCSNTEPYQISDHICYSDAVCYPDGSVSFKNQFVALSPTAGAWDSVHVCDPSVISGSFYYLGATYNYLMAYLGCSTIDNQQNQIGLAVSNNLSSGWIKIASNPIVPCSYDTNCSSFQWGVGQPSLINLDGAGHVLLFYTEGTSNLTCTKAQEWELSNLDTPTLVASATISNAGTNDFISNADFALSGNTLYMICDTHPFGGTLLNGVPDTSNIYSCTWDGVTESLNAVTWSKICSVNKDNTGFLKNHNCGLFRTVGGNLAGNGCIYTSACENVDFLTSLCTYRLRCFEW